MNAVVDLKHSFNSLLSSDAREFMEGRADTAAKVHAADMSWYVTFVAPSLRTAGRVEEFMNRMQIESYWPRLRRQKKRPVRGTVRKGAKTRYEIVEIVLAVLPRYVLVRLPTYNPPFGLLTNTEAKFNGICGLVSTASDQPGCPTIISDERVEELKRREAAGEWAELLPTKPPVGSTVRIMQGPFASFNAIIEEWIAEGRVKVEVTLFGRKSPIELSEDQVEQLSR